jgi:hypothetical protein
MNLLDLLALASLLACGVAGAVIMARAMAQAALDPTRRCVVCGQPAATLTSFICPGCESDVRQRGLRGRRGRTPAGVLAGASAILLLVLLLAAIVMLALPPSQTQERAVRMDIGFSPTAWMRPKPFNSVQATLVGAGAPDEPLRGQLWLDLVFEDASWSTLEISLPSRQTKIYPLNGGPGRDAGKLDRPLVQRWMKESGAAESPQREQCLDEILPNIERLINTGEFPRQSLTTRSSIMMGGSGGSGHRSLNRTTAFQLGLWPMVFVALLWLALSPRGRRRDAVEAPVA